MTRLKTKTFKNINLLYLVVFLGTVEAGDSVIKTFFFPSLAVLESKLECFPMESFFLLVYDYLLETNLIFYC
jgi:hypothetical protein